MIMLVNVALQSEDYVSEILMKFRSFRNTRVLNIM